MKKTSSRFEDSIAGAGAGLMNAHFRPVEFAIQNGHSDIEVENVISQVKEGYERNGVCQFVSLVLGSIGLELNRLKPHLKSYWDGPRST